MHVIVINDCGFVNGGAAQVAITSLKALARRAEKVTFVFGEGPLDRRIDTDAIKTVDFVVPSFLKRGFIRAAKAGIWNSGVYMQVVNMLKDVDRSNTVVHLHNWESNLSCSVIAALNDSGVSFTSTLHSYLVICPNGGLYDYNRNAHCNLAPMSLACLKRNCDSRSYYHKAWRVLRQLMQRRAYDARAAHFIAVSEYSARLMAPHLPENSRVRVIENPIDVEKQAPALPALHRRFAFIGRLTKQKGADIFARAAVKANVEAVFVGEGPYRAELAKLCPHAKFVGWCDRTVVASIIRESRAVVYPTVLHETQGLVVLEAAACGVPSIVSDGCAAVDAIEPDVSGLVFRAGDEDSLAAALHHLNNDETLAAKLGLIAYARFWDAPPTIDAHADRLMSYYRELLAAKATG